MRDGKERRKKKKKKKGRGDVFAPVHFPGEGKRKNTRGEEKKISTAPPLDRSENRKRKKKRGGKFR